MPLSLADQSAAHLQLVTDNDEAGDHEFIESLLSEVLRKIEDCSRSGMTYTIAGWHDRINELMSEAGKAADALRF